MIRTVSSVKHYCDVTMSTMVSQIKGISTVANPFVQAHIIENTKGPRQWSFLEESTGNCRIALTKGQ